MEHNIKEKSNNTTSLSLLGEKDWFTSSNLFNLGFPSKVGTMVSYFPDRFLLNIIPKKYNIASTVFYKDIHSINISKKFALGYLCYALLALLAATASPFFLLLFLLFLWLGLNSKITVNLNTGAKVIFYESNHNNALTFKHNIEILTKEYFENKCIYEKRLCEDLFDVSDVCNYNDQNFITAFDTMCDYIDLDCSIETHITKLENIGKEHSEWATKNLNATLFNEIKAQIKNILTNDETLLLYINNGILNNSKNGIAITDKRIIRIKKGEFTSVLLSEINILSGMGVAPKGCSWYVNKNKNIEINSINCSLEEQGAIIALICMLYKNSIQTLSKIKICIAYEHGGFKL